MPTHSSRGPRRAAYLFSAVIAVGLLGACAESSTEPVDTGSPNPPPGDTTTVNPTVLLDRATIPASGGTIVVDRLESRLHGLTVTLETGTYSTATEWTVTEEPDITPNFPAGITLAAPVFRIGNGQRFANEPFVLRIPVELDEGEVPVAFIRDPVTGALELVPPLGIDEDRAHFSVMTKHVSRAQMWIPNAGAGQPMFNVASGSEAISGSSTFGEEIQFFILRRRAIGPPGQVQTTFRPGTDDWEFPNIGSTISRGGFCAGSTVTAMYYHYFRRPWQGPLFGRFTKGAFEPEDVIENAQGLRLASVVQEQLDWGALLKHMLIKFPKPTYETYSLPYIQFVTLVTAMEVTGLPQLVGVFSANYQSGHALIAHGVDGGTVKIADPNYPGQSVEIRWGDHWVYGADWEPFSFAEIQGGPSSIYTKVWPVGTSTLIDVDLLHYHWDQFDAGVAGDAEFPAKAFEYLDPELDGTWRWAGDTIRTANDSLVFRWRCPTCSYAWYTTSDVERQYTAIVVAGPPAAVVGLDWYDEEREGASFIAEEEGRQRVGVIHATKYDGSPTWWRYANFNWITVHKFPFQISMDTEAPDVGEEIVFRIEDEDDLKGMQPRFRWDFGDGSAVTETQGSGTTSHTYRDPGAYVVTVELIDAAGEVVARTSTQVAVGQPGAWVGWVHSTHTGANGITYAEANDLRFEYVSGGETVATRWKLVSGELKYWRTVPCASYTSPITQRPLGPGDNTRILARDSDPWAPEAHTPGTALWYQAYGNASGLQIWNKVCPTDLHPNPEAYVFQTFINWLQTWDIAMPQPWPWLQSGDGDLLEGTMTETHGGTARVWTWRFERVLGGS